MNPAQIAARHRSLMRRANSGAGTVPPSFNAPLQISLAVIQALGSGIPTFTCASTAYQIDFEAKHNLVLSGEARMQGARRVYNRIAGSNNDLSSTTGNWDQTKGAVGTYGATDPLGGSTATTVVFASGVSKNLSNNGGDTGAHYTVGSVWAKSVSGTATFRFDLYESGIADHLSPDIAVTTTWQRFSYAFNNTGTTGRKGMAFFNDSGNGAQTVVFWGAQFDYAEGRANQNPSEIVSVGVLSAPYHGANVDGVQYFNTLNGNTVSSNVVTEATGAPIVAGAAGVAATAPVDANGPYGEIDEPSYQNLIGTTAAKVRTMTDAGWVNGGTLTVGAATGVDGVASAGARLTAGAVAGTNTILFTPGLASAERIYALPIKRITGTGPIRITGDGTNYTDISVQLNTSKAVIVSIDAGSVVPVVGIKMDTNLDVIDVDFNMLVAGSVAPVTPIPVNVTTAADVLQYVSAGNINANALSLTMSLTPGTALGSTAVFHWASYVDANNYTAILSDGTNLIARKRIGGTNHDATIAWARTVGAALKLAASFGSNGINIAVAGVLGTPDATATAAQIGTNFQVGADGNGANQDYSEHRLFNAYPVALSAAKLQAMTTP